MGVRAGRRSTAERLPSAIELKLSSEKAKWHIFLVRKDWDIRREKTKVEKNTKSRFDDMIFR